MILRLFLVWTGIITVLINLFCFAGAVVLFAAGRYVMGTMALFNAILVFPFLLSLIFGSIIKQAILFEIQKLECKRKGIRESEDVDTLHRT